MLYIRNLQHFSDENWGISVKTGEESVQCLEVIRVGSLEEKCVFKGGTIIVLLFVKSTL